MKKLLIGLLVIGSSFAYSGTIMKRGTTESLEFIDNQDGTIEMIARTSMIDSSTFNGSFTKAYAGPTNAMSYTREILDAGADDWVFLPVSVTFEGIYYLAVQAPNKLIQQMKLNKDFKVLKRAFFYSDKTINVTAKRFSRIVTLLKGVVISN